MKEHFGHGIFICLCHFEYSCLFQCLLMFLQAQNNVFPMLPIVVSQLYCMYLFFGSRCSSLDMGTKALRSQTESLIEWMSLLGLYARFSSSYKETWTGFSKKSLDIGGIIKFLKLALLVSSLDVHMCRYTYIHTHTYTYTYILYIYARAQTHTYIYIM